jgi:MFS family permease
MADQTVAERVPAVRSRVSGFPVVVAVLVLFQAASSAPAPLYVVYQHAWRFSAAALTLVFAVFVFGLLAALLTGGARSDRLGRRPVLAAAIALEALALVLFLTAGGVGALVAARAVQGLATGLALPTISAALVDLERAPGRASLTSGVVPIGGLAVGALTAGALVQYAPDPTHLIWIVLLVLFAVALVTTRTITETAGRHRAGGPGERPDTGSGAGSGTRAGGWRELVPRWSLPVLLRRPVAALVPLIVAGWALGGLYLSLGPSVAAGVFGATNHLVGGLVVTMLCGTGAAAAFALRGRSPRAAVWLSTGLLAVGTAVALAGALSGEAWLAAAGTVVAGVGYGASGLATFGALARLAGSADAAARGGLFAVAYTVAYLSFSLPALVAGWAATVVGLHATVVGYAGLVIVVVLVALALVRRSAGDR